jgi:predicted pyridoxine 5'-phosphate oxidase superfamily flavin-nucleotide-binding protein
MTGIIDKDMRAVIAAQRLCFAATVTPGGLPSLSPNGTIRVWDDWHLFYCDIYSAGTRKNLLANPWIELNVVDPISRRGYRFFGKATIHVDDEIYTKATERVFREENSIYRVHSVILIAVERALPLISPGYEHVPDEGEMRRVWKERRTQLDAAFEIHIKNRDSMSGAKQE